MSQSALQPASSQTQDIALLWWIMFWAGVVIFVAVMALVILLVSAVSVMAPQAAPPEGFSLGMKPAPTAIAALARQRSPQDLYQVMEQGIKMSGMPACAYRMSEEDMWQIVALIKQIPDMTHAITMIICNGPGNRPSPG